MRLSRDLVHNQSPEYRQALQELIRFELQALVERLSATGEEALILTASTGDGTLTQFGSSKAEGFLQKHTALGSDFLTYCNDENTQSSADELGTFEEDAKNNKKGGDDKSQEASTVPYPPIRKRERTISRHLSITESPPKTNVYQVSQNSDISASERNDSASSVSSFVEAKQNKNDLQCKICSRTFRSYRALNQHFRLHMAKSYKCGSCGKIFSMKKSYERHIKTHKKDKLYECSVCDRSFPDQYSLQRHREGHVSVRNYSCNLCGMAFYEKYSLRVHQTSHFSSQKFEKILDSASGYSCHICQKLSKTKTALKNHMLTHSAKKYTCEFCNKRFSLKYSYVRHRRIHTGEKPYKCGSCDKSFSDGSAWAKHARTHSGIKPYSCSICYKSFFYKTACKTHIQNHQGKKSKQQIIEKRNFEMVTTNVDDLKFESPSRKDTDVGNTPKLGYESDSESHLYDEELNLQLEECEKGFDESELLDSGFGADLLPAATKLAEEKKKPGLIESVHLDERFQTEFVERNMPIKGLESVNELISTTFPDESDILEEEIETENRTEIQEDIKVSVKVTSPMKHSQRKFSRRSNIGKQLPEIGSKCKKCHKVFHQESMLKQHLQFHCMMKLYKCRYCGKQLSTKHSLVRHERIHVGDRPYQCYICQKKFADNYSCIRHIKIHFTHDEKTPPVLSRTIGNSSPTKSVMNTSTQLEGQPVSSQKSEAAKLSACPDHSKGTLATDKESFQTTDGFKQVKQTYQIKDTDSVITPSPVVKVSGENNLQRDTRGNNTAAYSFQGINVSSVNTTETLDRKQLYKCYACSTLFDTHQNCVKHIERGCDGSKLASYTTESGKSVKAILGDGTQVKNLYQCSLCSKMFDSESVCQSHIRDECLKAQVSSECASQSILSESLQYSDLTQEDTDLNLPHLPFTELDSEQNYLNMATDDVMFLPGQYESSVMNSPQTNINSTTVETKKSPSYIPISQLKTQGNSTIQFGANNQTSSSLSTSIPFTGLVQKSVVNLGQSNYLVTNQGFSLVPSPGLGSSATEKHERAVRKVDSDINEKTCSICNKVFTTKHILKQHTLIHMERKFGCKYCMKKFHNKYGRDRHERIHTGEKPFSCPNCKKAFSDNSTYRKHTRVCCSGK